MGCRFLRILRAGSGKQNRLRRKWRTVHLNAAQSDSGGNIPDGIHHNGNDDVQRPGTAVEPFCCFLLPDYGCFLRISEVKNTNSAKNFKKVAEKFGSKEKRRTFAIPNEKWSVRITVSTQDSQSCNRGSIPLPTTPKEVN